MNRGDEMFGLVVEANPFPRHLESGVAVIEGIQYLEELEDRGSDEVTQTETKPPEEKTKRPATIWLLAAVVAIVAGIAMILLAQSDEDTPVQPVPTTVGPVPTSVVTNNVDGEALGRELVGAFVAFDAESLVEAAPRADLTELEYLIPYNQTLNLTVVDDIQCSVEADDSITCAFAKEDDLTRRLGVEQVETWVISLADGEISGVSTDTRGGEEQFASFNAWLLESRPEVSDGACLGFLDDGMGAECATATLAALEDYASVALLNLEPVGTLDIAEITGLWESNDGFFVYLGSDGEYRHMVGAPNNESPFVGDQVEWGTYVVDGNNLVFTPAEDAAFFTQCSVITAGEAEVMVGVYEITEVAADGGAYTAVIVDEPCQNRSLDFEGTLIRRTDWPLPDAG